MPITSLYDETSPVRHENTAAVPARTIVILIAGMSAAWIAAGSTGLLAHPLRHALTWIAMGVAIVAGWPCSSPSSPRESAMRWAAVAGGAVVGIVMTASNLPVFNVLGVVMVLAALSYVQTGLTGRILLLVAISATVLALFRLACTSVPAAWLVADSIGGAMGSLVGNITGQPLRIGATFAGLDFLVLMGALFTGWLICTTPPRLGRAVYAAVAILAGQLVYLIVLSFSPRLVSALPEVVMPPPIDVSHMGVWTWGNAVRSILPWNLPLLAGIIQVVVAALMFRWVTWRPVIEPAKEKPLNEDEDGEGRALTVADLLWLGSMLLAVAIPLLTVLGKGRSSLKGKRIVAYNQGFVDWKKPEHDTTDPGTYGILPLFIKSLRGEFVPSSDLSEEDLAEADVLLLIHPNQSWPKDRLERVWQFVRDGGSLLVAAEPERLQGDKSSRFNEVLEPTGMQVRCDTVIPSTRLWEQVCTVLAHPATAGMDDRRNPFGLVQAASIETRMPARPLLVGQFAFSEPGSDAVEPDARTKGPRAFRNPLAIAEWEYDPGKKDYDSGKQLGDLVLAAEQRFGNGRIVVLGDSSPLHNFVLPSAYLFTGRLLGYLANQPGSPQAVWRQLLGLLAIAGFVGLLAWRAAAERIAVAAVVFAASLALCLSSVHRSAMVLPTGEPTDSTGRLAYIDASHLEAYSSNTWGRLGVGGLTRTLMRNGYLPLLLPELTSQRLAQADLLISIGPSGRFTMADRRAIGEFVRGGGTFILMAGSEASRPCQELLDDFDFDVPPSPVPPGKAVLEPEPLAYGLDHYGGLINYLDLGDYSVAMHLDSPWKIDCFAEGSNVIQFSEDGDGIIIRSRAGKGSIVVIGDTLFAANRNLESEHCQYPQNTVYWRWFLSRVTDSGGEVWIPPKPEPADDSPTELEPPDDSLVEPEPSDRSTEGEVPE